MFGKVGEGPSRAAVRGGLVVCEGWVQRGDHLTAGKPGPRAGHKLDWQALQAALKKRDDATLAELAQQFDVSHNAIWYALKRL